MKTQLQRMKERLEAWHKPIAARMEQAASYAPLPDVHDHDHGDESGSTRRPLPPGTSGARVTSEYGVRTMGGVKKMHYGVDIGAGKNPTYAAADGYISHAGPAGTAGNMVIIQRKGSDGNNHQYVYMHLDSIAVRQGQMVKKGDVIGIMGETGRADGVHLHLEHRILVPTYGGIQEMHVPPTREEINAAVPGAIKDK
jgi:murein DD-endopeptidase MepM/ murein hydrolase activator NlpD